jgi:GTP-binding protein
LPTRQLNDTLREAIAAVEPPRQRGKRARIYYATALGSAPPTIALFVNHPSHVTTPYLRYLENRLRDVFPLEGTPVRILTRARPRQTRRRPDRTDKHWSSAAKRRVSAGRR